MQGGRRTTRMGDIARAVALALLVHATAVKAQRTGRRAESPQAAIELYFDALRDRDTTSLRAVLHQSMRLTTVIQRGDRPAVLALAADDLVNTVSRATGEPWVQSLRVSVWSVDGNVAALWSRYSFHRGQVPDHCGVLAVHFTRVTDGWAILHVTDTHETADCG